MICGDMRLHGHCSQPRCRAQMLFHADQLGLMLKQLQLVDILAVFALACTASDMNALVWTWLRDQSELRMDKLLGSRHAIFSMTQMVRARLSASLSRFCVGKSFFCFDGERDGRDRFMFFYENNEEGAPLDLSLAQLVLPFFQVTAYWHYYSKLQPGQDTTAPRERSTLLQHVRAAGLNLGDIGAASIVFALRHLDASAVYGLDFQSCGLTDVGAKELAGLLGELPALTHLDLSCNPLSAQRKGAITRACRKRPSSMPAACVYMGWY